MNQRAYYKTLRFKLISGVVLVLAVMMSAFFFYQHRGYRRVLLEKLADSTTAFSEAIEEGLDDLLAARDVQRLQERVEELTRREGLEALFVINKRGEIKFSADRTEVNQQLSISNPVCQECHQYAPESRSKTVIFDPGTGYRIFRNVNPIEMRSECYPCHSVEEKLAGVMVVDVSIADIDRELAADFGRMLLSLFSTILITAVILGILINQTVIRKVSRLLEGIRLFGKGHPREPIGPGGDDEIGDLVNAFDEMTVELTANEQEIRRRNQELGALNEVGRAASRSLELDRVLYDALGKVLELMQADAGAIFLMDGPGEPWRLAAHVGLSQEARKAICSFEFSEDPVGCEVRLEQPALVGDLSECSDFPAAQWVSKATSFRSFVRVPFVSQGRTWGTMSVYSTTSHLFTSHEVELLIGAAGQIAMAVENARLYQNIRASEEKYHTLLENASDAIFVIAPEDAHLLDVNQQAENMTGYSRDELLRMKITDLHVPGEHAYAYPAFEEALNEGSVPFGDLYYRRKDGSRVPVEISARLVDYGGRQVVFAISRDRTEQKRLQRQLLQWEKLQALGQMAAGVAHELNTPLGTILGYAQMLEEEVDEEESRSDIRAVAGEARRCKKIVQNLLSFSRSAQLEERSPQDINRLIQRAIALAEHDLSLRHVAVRLSLEDGRLPVVAHEHEIVQVFLNLMYNAADAMPGGGEIRIISRFQAPEHAYVQFSDTGCGIPPEHLDHIFEPFYTTKEVGRGTGLGLSLSYRIIQDYGGTIEVESEVGVGSRFMLTLPLRRVLGS